MGALTEHLEPGAEHGWASLSEGWNALRTRAGGAPDTAALGRARELPAGEFVTFAQAVGCAKPQRGVEPGASS